jgi:hypothetical protein
MGPCEPGQGRKSAAISSSHQVRWASHPGPTAQSQGDKLSRLGARPPAAAFAGTTPALV